MTYDEAMAYIASLEPRGWRLGLDRMAEFIKRAGLGDAIGGEAGPKFVHVAGTNGKGSTTAFLQSLLIESGHRTGAFFSPFVLDPRERVQFGRQHISKEDIAQITTDLMPVAEGLTETDFGGVTEFEFKAAIGFAYWKLKNCDWVALEVGLGGRLDATNVVTPKVSIITSISLDHTSILGNSLAEIATEKAGIIKPRVPILTGSMPAAAFDVIQEVAAKRDAPLWQYGKHVYWRNGVVHTPRREHRDIRHGIRGSIQEVNVSLAIAALDAVGLTEDEEAVRLGALRAQAPGRMQEVKFRSRVMVLDGAHNSEAAVTLAESMNLLYPGRRVHLISNMLLGHEVGPFYEPLRPLLDSVHVVPIDFHRARSVDETVTDLRTAGFEAVPHFDISSALDAAAAQTTPEQVILVTGSFYLVGEVFRHLPTT